MALDINTDKTVILTLGLPQAWGSDPSKPQETGKLADGSKRE